MNTISVAILGLNTVMGEELVDKILHSELISSVLEIEGIPYYVKIKPPIFNGDQYNMLKTCMEDDIVIFDASIEKDETNSFDSNYAAATANPGTLDNVLVVSRTRLPLNFTALRTNVLEVGQDKDENGKTIKNYTNDEILEWIKNEIKLMSGEEVNGKKYPPRLPSKGKMDIPPFEHLSEVPNKLFFKTLEDKMADALDFMNSTKKKGAFISYRSDYYNKKYKEIVSGKDLETIIKDRHKEGKDYPVTIYKGGDIASEFMTEQRRWEIVSFVDRKLRSVDEVWIFETDDYYNSWWTQGEIISLMYIKAGNGVKALPKIIVYKFDDENNRMIIEEKNTDEEKSVFIPDMPLELHIEMARYFANADAGRQGNENMKNMRLLRSLGTIFQRIAFWQTKRIQKKYMQSDIMSDIMKDMTFSDYKKSIYSHVYEESFTENRIVTCPNPNCQTDRQQKKMTIKAIKDFANPQVIRDFIQSNSEMNGRRHKDEIEARGFFSISPTVMTNIIKNREWKCPKCGSGKKIKIDDSHYRWWPIRLGQITGPNNVIIEELENWVFEE